MVVNGGKLDAMLQEDGGVVEEFSLGGNGILKKGIDTI